MTPAALDPSLVARAHARAKAGRWDVSVDRFGEALVAGLSHAEGLPSSPQTDAARRVDALHLEDLALACACADGHERAWEHFVREYRPALHRAAAAVAPAGQARELADSLYGELFGLTEREGARRSLFRYFHGRSSLATWLRAVLAQRWVDATRRQRHLAPLPDEDGPAAPAAPARSPAPERMRFLRVLSLAIQAAVGRLAPRDRLRLTCYYAQHLTLGQIGKTLGEHEATVSRHLTRARAVIRKDVERHLRENEGMNEAEIDECVRSVVDDAGPLELTDLLADGMTRKSPGADRST